MFENKKFIDLTHPLDNTIPTWTGGCGFQESLKLDYDGGCRVYSYKMHAGIGTHIDAPSHFVPGGENIADMPIENFICETHLIDVRDKSHENYLISVADIKRYEASHGSLRQKSFVIGYTGWMDRWNTPEKYRNQDSSGKMRFPGFHKDAAEYLLQKNICGIGIDTLSPDGSTDGFPVHHAILGSNKYIIENLCNLSQVPNNNFYTLSLPIKVSIGTEAACRTIAII